MGNREASARDRALCWRVERDYGERVEPRQLRRWRGWRRVGLIPRPPERVRGFRPGLVESLPADEVERVAEVAELVRVEGGLDMAGLALAARGRLDDDGARAHLDGDEGAQALLASVRDAFVAYQNARLERAGRTEAGQLERRGTRGPRRSHPRALLVRDVYQAFGYPLDFNLTDYHSDTGRRQRRLRYEEVLEQLRWRDADRERLRTTLVAATPAQVHGALRRAYQSGQTFVASNVRTLLYPRVSLDRYAIAIALDVLDLYLNRPEDVRKTLRCRLRPLASCSSSQIAALT